MTSVKHKRNIERLTSVISFYGVKRKQIILRYLEISLFIDLQQI